MPPRFSSDFFSTAAGCVEAWLDSFVHPDPIISVDERTVVNHRKYHVRVARGVYGNGCEKAATVYTPGSDGWRGTTFVWSTFEPNWYTPWP